jgi:hypothetical protein
MQKIEHGKINNKFILVILIMHNAAMIRDVSLKILDKKMRRGKLGRLISGQRSSDCLSLRQRRLFLLRGERRL